MRRPYRQTVEDAVWLFESGEWPERTVFPLLDPALHMNRADCMAVIRDAGLPIPPKSSCFFCPFHTLDVWTRMREDEPDLFAESVRIEREISQKAGEPRYLTRFGAPLEEIVPVGVETLPFDLGDGSECMSGACAT